MRLITQLTLVVLLAYVAFAQRADFLRMMKERANPAFNFRPNGARMVAPKMPSVPTVPKMPSAPTVPTAPRMPTDQLAKTVMMSDEFDDGSFSDERAQLDADIARQDQERLQREKERQEQELQRQREEIERQNAQREEQEENMQKFREKELELEERLKQQAEALEEQRLQREQAERERQEAHQQQLEEQRLALEAHRMELENHRKEMEEARREKERENQERFREHQQAIEDKVRAQEEQLREQEAAQREFEAAQKEQEQQQRAEEKERWQSQNDQLNGNFRMISNVEDVQAVEKAETVKTATACDTNPCKNSGECQVNDSGFVCVCKKPWTGELCETVWENPCTEENLRKSDISQFKDPWNSANYIICTDINVFHSMPCSGGTYFNEDYGHCVRVGYNPPMCPRDYCKNDAECIMNEDKEFKCICKLGFTGEFCEENINECEVAGGNEACKGGECVDQLNGFYCKCANDFVGLNCQNTIKNPCDREAIESQKEFFVLPSDEARTYLHCTSLNNFVVSNCADKLFWNQEKRACVLDKPEPKSGRCLEFPCQNGGECQDVDGVEYKCACKDGFEGEHCETMIDSCASNPCQNGGRCLAYAGGYTCACPDKIIDECCCHSLKNPCPKKSMIIPGVNNYFPHLFTDRYIHCDFDGRAFSRKCSKGLVWSQNTLTCLPANFLETKKPEMKQKEEEVKDLFVDQQVEINQEEEEKKREQELKERQEALKERQRVRTLRLFRRQ